MRTVIQAVNMTVVFVQEISRIYAQKPVENDGKAKCVELTLPNTTTKVYTAYSKTKNAVICKVGDAKFEPITSGKINREQVVRAIIEIAIQEETYTIYSE